MTIGLTSEQLLSTLFTSINRRILQGKGELDAAMNNENPQLQEVIKALEAKFPIWLVLWIPL